MRDYDIEEGNGDYVVVKGLVSIDKLASADDWTMNINQRIVADDFIFTLRRRGDNAHHRAFAQPKGDKLVVADNPDVLAYARDAGLTDVNCSVPVHKDNLARVLDQYDIRKETKPKKETTCLFYQGTDAFPEDKVLAEFEKGSKAIDTGNWGTELELQFHPEFGCIEYRMQYPDEEGIALRNNMFCLAISALPKVLQRKLRSINGFRT